MTIINLALDPTVTETITTATSGMLGQLLAVGGIGIGIGAGVLVLKRGWTMLKTFAK